MLFDELFIIATVLIGIIYICVTVMYEIADGFQQSKKPKQDPAKLARQKRWQERKAELDAWQKEFDWYERNTRRNN